MIRIWMPPEYKTGIIDGILRYTIALQGNVVDLDKLTHFASGLNLLGFSKFKQLCDKHSDRLNEEIKHGEFFLSKLLELKTDRMSVEKHDYDRILFSAKAAHAHLTSRLQRVADYRWITRCNDWKKYPVEYSITSLDHFAKTLIREKNES